MFLDVPISHCLLNVPAFRFDLQAELATTLARAEKAEEDAGSLRASSAGGAASAAATRDALERSQRELAELQSEYARVSMRG
jgi:archaellum component FlaC